MRSIPLIQAATILSCPGNFSSSPIKGYCIDSRLIKPGELFFALKGERADGHHHLEEVMQKGACGAVVSTDYKGTSKGLPLLFVEDPLLALQTLSQKLLQLTPIRIVAITGSIGKTSTKEFTKTLLSSKFRVAASPGNSNSQVGVPLTILNHTNGEEEILVIEMGMTLPGELARLVEIAPPEVSVITTVALVHACNFDSIREIAWAKGEILSHLQTRLGIINKDIPYFDEICKIGQCPKVSFSIATPTADFYFDAENPELLEDRLENKTHFIGPLPIPGRHNRQNLLAAIAVARYFKMPWEDIKEAITHLALPDRRLQFVRRQGVLFLNDSYNASELSVKAALETLPQPQSHGRKIAVLGSMMELGKFSDECHRKVGEFALNHVERLYCLGDECLPMVEVWKKEGRGVEHFKNRSDLVDRLRVDLKPADVVLLKASCSKELWKVLEEI
jgi:UDP-N-acetylmuramoyl-tripeptide--D-alanyl-D-alanine ligase